jgi:hypothetical protein
MFPLKNDYDPIFAVTTPFSWLPEGRWWELILIYQVFLVLIDQE